VVTKVKHMTKTPDQYMIYPTPEGEFFVERNDEVEGIFAKTWQAWAFIQEDKKRRKKKLDR